MREEERHARQIAQEKAAKKLNRLIVGGYLFLLALVLVVPGFYTIRTGNVGVEETLGKVNLLETPEGLNWVFWPIQNAWEYSGKTITVDLSNMKPKADDNLSLRDLDVTIFYKVTGSQIADLYTKYAEESVVGEEGWKPGYELVLREARSSVYEAVAKIDSLEMHRNREVLSTDIRETLQKKMNEKEKDTFFIKSVAVRQLVTDPSIEKAIQQKVEAEKTLEAKQIQVEIAQKDAEIEIERAKGVAESNKIINNSLTAAYLQHEINKALHKFADNGNSSVVIPANMEGFEMILDQKRVGAGAQ